MWHLTLTLAWSIGSKLINVIWPVWYISFFSRYCLLSLCHHFLSNTCIKVTFPSSLIFLFSASQLLLTVMKTDGLSGSRNSITKSLLEVHLLSQLWHINYSQVGDKHVHSHSCYMFLYKEKCRYWLRYTAKDCKLSKPVFTSNDWRKHVIANSCPALSVFCLYSINYTSAYVGSHTPGRRRSVLGTLLQRA